MRYALISDVHANLPALQAVLRDIKERNEQGQPVKQGEKSLAVAGEAGAQHRVVGSATAAPVARVRASNRPVAV